MDVRLARPTDAPLALRLALDEEAHLVRSFGWPAANPVSRTLLRAAFPLAIPGRTWLARDQGAVALLEAEPRRYVIGWDITRLAIRGDATRVMAAIVQAATDHVRARGIPRLFARCPGEQGCDLLACGFTALARELVMVGPDGPISGEEELPYDCRYRMPQDAWPLHQLESEVTPALVRHLEGLTSLDWSARKSGVNEIVVERDGRVVAWIGWGAGPARGYRQIGMLAHPRYADAAPMLLAHVLHTAPQGARFVARVRDYQPEVVRAFEEMGFTEVTEEVLLVKHARVEEARAARPRIAVATVPGVHAFRTKQRTPAPSSHLAGRAAP